VPFFFQNMGVCGMPARKKKKKKYFKKPGGGGGGGKIDH